MPEIALEDPSIVKSMIPICPFFSRIAWNHACEGMLKAFLEWVPSDAFLNIITVNHEVIGLNQVLFHYSVFQVSCTCFFLLCTHVINYYHLYLCGKELPAKEVSLLPNKYCSRAMNISYLFTPFF